MKIRHSLNQSVSVSPYDMGWLLRSKVLLASDQSKLIQKLLSLQKDDGSWGAGIIYLHDRVINTLSIIVALKSININNKNFSDAINFLEKNLSGLMHESIETIGFELTFPKLINEAKELGVTFKGEDRVMKKYNELREKKLSVLPLKLCQKPTTILHSLESFTKEEIGDIIPLVFENGSIGNSIAATVFYHNIFNDKRSEKYLKSFISNDFSCPSIWPFEIFEIAWVLYTKLHKGQTLLGFSEELDYLYEHFLRFNGASISNSFPIIDSDDTAVVYYVLKRTGYEVNQDVFDQFETKTHYRCFDLERNPSISANIHVLDALKISPVCLRRAQSIKKILNLLRRSINPRGYFIDKWHISPYYCTSHAIIALEGIDNHLRQRCIDYLVSSQNKDGGWGVNGSTHEETNYCLMVLPSRYTDCIKLANNYLRDTKNSFEELWVDKGLYCPINVVKNLCE